MRTAIATVVLLGALYGCGSADPAGQGMGGAAAGAGGTASAAGTSGAAGEARGGAGGEQSGGGATALGGRGGSAVGAGGRAGIGTAGSSGAAGSSPSGTGGTAGAPPTCTSLGWTPGDASLCAASKGAFACAFCYLPLGGTGADCLAVTDQNVTVLCTDCASCR